MKTKIFPGCCNARVYFDLGGAHQIENFSCQEEFDIEMEKKACFPINMCITSTEQSRAREYLRTQSWQEQVFGDLILHTISGINLSRYLTNARKRRQREADFIRVN